MWELQTRAALSPAAGLAIMRENVPQVVFLDISMPGVTGFEVLAFLRREPALAEVPVIIVTSDDQPETKVRALQNGAQGLIVKPVMPERQGDQRPPVGEGHRGAIEMRVRQMGFDNECDTCLLNVFAGKKRAIVEPA